MFLNLVESTQNVGRDTSDVGGNLKTADACQIVSKCNPQL